MENMPFFISPPYQGLMMTCSRLGMLKMAEAWDACKKLAIQELSNKKLYVMDVFCGTNKDTRMAIRFIMEVAWQAHFVKNMFIAPTEEELKNFKPDFISYNASKANLSRLMTLA